MTSIINIGELAEFLKHGLLGLSAIALILTFLLLAREQARRGAARPNILDAIKRFMWTSILFLVVSGILELFGKRVSDPNRVSAVEDNCNKSFVLYVSIDPDSILNKFDEKDSINLKYLEKRSDTKERIIPVYREISRSFRVVIDSVKGENIYNVKLVNVTKNMQWGSPEISVSHGKVQLR